MAPHSQQSVLSVFLASSVHDMKNSVSMLTGSLEQFLAELTPETFHAYQQMAHMLFEVKRVNSNLTQLLALYKVGDQRYPFDPQPHAISQLVLETLSQNQALLDSKHITIATEYPADLVWHFDEDLVSGIINHALNNAIRYTRDKVRLVVSVNADWLEIRVEDNGPGYPQTMLDDAEMMKGVNFSTGSTGLGLYFSREVAKMHMHRGRHGTVQLENAGLWNGGCFILKLP
jgi:two-component system, OmpR family, sensor histidine kinase SenX3